jgi:hypothetical protein
MLKIPSAAQVTNQPISFPLLGYLMCFLMNYGLARVLAQSVALYTQSICDPICSHEQGSQNKDISIREGKVRKAETNGSSLVLLLHA